MKNLCLNIKLLIVCSCITLVGCKNSSQGLEKIQHTNSLQIKADIVYRGGNIYTVDAEQTWAEAVAIRDGKFIVVGSDTDVKPYVGDGTRVVELDGRMIMPGIYDQHVHPVDAGLRALFECNFPPDISLGDIADSVATCSKELSKTTWIRGGVWDSGLLESDNKPHKAILDRKVPDHPVYLWDLAGHNAWLNSKALELLGYDKNTRNPEGGVFLRDANGELTGVLIENAAFKAMDLLPARTEEQYRDATLWAVAELNRLGVVGIKEAFADRHTVSAYSSLDRDEKLNIRVAASLPWKATGAGSSFEDQSMLIDNYQQHYTKWVDPRHVKILIDGIPMGKTSAFLDPYMPDEIHGNDFRGQLLIDAEELKQDLIRLDNQGMSVMMHSAGDASSRAALDAIEAARRVNGDSGVPHQVAHTSYVNSDDYPRYQKLGAVAEFSPVLWYPSILLPAFDAALGQPRSREIYPIKSLITAGALGVYGSDWPVVPSPDPWSAMEAMVTRADPYGETPGTLWVEEAIEIATAIEIFTLNGSKSMRLGETAGSIEVEKSADLIVIDRNIFEVNAHDIGDTKVLQTLLSGKVIYAIEGWEIQSP